MLFFEFALPVLLFALCLDLVIGDPDWLWKRLPHPVVVMGNVISLFERSLNKQSLSAGSRRFFGLMTMVILVGGFIALGLLFEILAQVFPLFILVNILLSAVLLAQRSLHEHVMRVAIAFRTNGLDGARDAVSHIVGRDPQTLDEGGIARASIETAAENFSDAIAAPAFWLCVGGMPGILAYKAINTADSMIGYRTTRYLEFGFVAARIDDLVNLVPARLSGLLFALSSFAFRRIGISLKGMMRDAKHHRSPNAGWPESAMAYGIDIALSGPRFYDGNLTSDAFLNPDGKPAEIDDIVPALLLYRIACALHILGYALLLLIINIF